ncbi:MAG: VTT domain-containing protein [Planctomycetaceae bacterium]|nr:VTT domain-containing protein [Planctomycetaceae bacterium]
MRTLWRPLAFVAFLLAVPVVPFLLFGPSLERTTETWLERTESPALVALSVVGILATDVLLPIPSSFVNTYAGAQLGIPLGAAAAWLGMTLGASGGFLLARWCGQPLVERWIAPDELARIEGASRRFGPSLVVVTRALPVLAEATVLFLGGTGLAWRRYWPAMALANLGLAVVYAAFGYLAREQGMVAIALVASIALPLVAATIARWLLAARVPT